MSLPRYPKYKHSGVEWLSEVPEHWDVKRLKHLATLTMGQSPSSDDCNPDGDGLPFLQGNADFGDAYPTARSFCSVATKVCKPDDILLSVRAPVGAINTADQSYGIGRGLCAITANPTNSIRFLFHAVHTLKSELFSVAAGSTYEAVTTFQVGNATCLAPPVTEQRLIAGFIDRETAKIDALIAEQQRLIELLKEKRQAVISHAVTKGLNPDAPMKPSGIEWLGEVPVHWEVVAAKRVAGVFVPQRNKPELNTVGDGVCWMTMEQMRDESVSSTDLWVSDAAASDSGSRVLAAGAVIASCVGTFGLASINNADVIINQQLQAYIPSARIEAKFLRYCVVNAGCYFEQIGTAATIAYVNQIGFESMPLAMPPVDEQRAIIDHLEEETARLDTLSAQSQQAIDLLQERRSALISAAVTGQIDVRGLANGTAG